MSKQALLPRAMRNFEQVYGGEIVDRIVITKDYLANKDGCLFIPASVFPFVEIPHGF